MRDSLLLLRTLLLSTSRANVYRHSKDARKRRRIVGEAIGYAVLYALLIAYCVMMCVGYGTFGLAGSMPVMCALSISLITFVLTLFKTNGHLFNFREYDLLMSLPFEPRTIAACRFLYMYVKSLPWCLCVALTILGGYGWFVRPPALAYPTWIVLSLFLPVIPMLAASLLGFLFARVSVRFRHTAIAQTVLTVAFVALVFSLRFVLEGVLRDGKARMAFEMVSEATDQAMRAYPPVAWFVGAVEGRDPWGALLLVATSALLFVAAFAVVGRSYRRLNSALGSHAASRRQAVAAGRQRSVVLSIAFKEFRRMMSSTVYLTNGATGVALALLLGVIALVVGFDQIVRTATRDAPFDPAVLRPALPLFVYFFVGMVATTSFTPSLEGRSYWIVQSLPIEKETLYQGKMLFNLLLMAPPALVSTLCLCASARVPALETLTYLLMELALCAFSTTWGCVCGIRHMRLDWENEVEVIKQGAAVTLYLLPNMFVTMGLCALVIFLGLSLDHVLLALLLTLVEGTLAALSYRWSLSLARKMG